MDPAWLSISALERSEGCPVNGEDLLASQQTLAEERVSANTKTCSNCIQLATALMLGHQPNVVALMEICIALQKNLLLSLQMY